MVFQSVQFRPGIEPKTTSSSTMASTLSANSHHPLHSKFPLPSFKCSDTHFRFPTQLPASAQNSPSPRQADEDQLDYATCSGSGASLQHQPPPVTAQEAKSKIFIRIRTKTKSSSSSGEGQVAAGDGDKAEPRGEEPSEEATAPPKTWNLRPRKPPVAGKASNVGAGPLRTGVMPQKDVKTRNQTSGRPELSRSRVVVNEATKADQEKKKKKTLSITIPLSKYEIEEDFLAMTGSKPSRRTSKRSRTVKKQLDSLFPGLHLDSIGLDSY
ncbi:hypothetical protein PanWU01x14_150160 [Parasponia andersonii]|uniref:Uncharacterized protein n=1 Tax=Parasponia andersonii TaxID=3476 RepID=A0A2P5CIL2_PARAD|nr:hypothetical protein PanWU01x14_150160 [Parasponia andersonii]